MTLPSGITTCTVTKSPPRDIQGNAGSILSATVRADRDLVWAATGETLYGVQDVDLTLVGDGLSFPLPHVDQAGFLDANSGAPVTNWYYTVTVQLAYGGTRRQTDTYRLQVVAGQATLDLDVIERQGTVLPSVTAPSAKVTSVFGKTGAVPDADVAAFMADRIANDATVQGPLDARIESTAVAAAVVANPGGGKVVVSSKLEHLHVDTAPQSRVEMWPGQEPSLWFANGVWNIVYTRGAGFGLGYRTCPGSADPLNPANWSAESVIVNLARSTPHAYVFVDGATPYLYFCDNADMKIYVATPAGADLTQPWTVNPTAVAGPFGNTSTKTTGNPGVVKIGSTYYMFGEGQNNDDFGDGDGATFSWQTYLYKSTSPTGPFALVYGPIKSLRMDGTGSVSGADPHLEDGNVVLYYHGNAWARYVPDDIHRAVIPASAIETDAWKLTDHGAPVLMRSHPKEVDQAVDPSVGVGPNGVHYLAYSGNDNTASVFRVMMTRLLPTKIVYDAAASNWKVAEHHAPLRSQWDYVAPRTHAHVPHVDPDGALKVGTWGLTSSPAGMYGNCRLTNTSAAQGDAIEFDVVLGPGTWRIRPVFNKGPDHGIVTVTMAFASKFFQTTIGSFDGYAAAQSLNSATILNQFIIRGRKTARARLRFEVTGKNASSTGYVYSDLGWLLYRTDY